MKAALALSAALLLAAPAPQAQAELIYDWSGTCSVGCTGNAHVQIVFKDSYVPGTPFAIPANRFLESPESPIANIRFIFGTESRFYTQFTGTETSGAFFHVEGGGLIPAAGGNGTLDLCFLSCVDNEFKTLLDGAWAANFEGSLIGAPPDGHLVHDEHWVLASGIGGIFTPRANGVPEPTTLALFALAFVAMSLRWKVLPRIA